MKCGCCGQDVYTNGICQVHGCKNDAEFEGWYENKDFSGTKTGYSRLVKVCSDHKCMLVAT